MLPTRAMQEMIVRDAAVGQPNAAEGFRPVTLVTSRGEVACRYYAAEGARSGTIWVGGVGGGFDTPARGLYPRLCRELVDEGISSLRVRFRHPTIREEAVLDTLAGLWFLEAEGVEATAVTGHSFGGAVAIQAGAAAPSARTVVTLATQSYGADPAGELAPRCSILLIHGTADEVLPPACSQSVHRMTSEPKRLLLLDGAGHVLDEVAEDVHDAVRDWIVGRLGRPPARAE